MAAVRLRQKTEAGSDTSTRTDLKVGHYKTQEKQQAPRNRATCATRTLYWGLGVAGLPAGFAVVAGLAAGLAGAAAAAPMRVADLMVSSLGQCWARYFSPPLEMFSWSMPEPSPYWS